MQQTRNAECGSRRGLSCRWVVQAASIRHDELVHAFVIEKVRDSAWGHEHRYSVSRRDSHWGIDFKPFTALQFHSENTERFDVEKRAEGVIEIINGHGIIPQ
jgi:hypothetical protein